MIAPLPRRPEPTPSVRPASLHRVRAATRVVLLLGVGLAGASDAVAERRSNAGAPWSGELLVARTVPLGGSPSAGAALLDRLAFVPMRSGHVRAVNLDTGAIVWTVELATSRGLAAGDGLLFAATADAVVAIDADGSQQWSLPVADGFSADPVWDGGWLVVSTTAGDVLALRARDGDVVWTTRLLSPVVAPPAIGHDRIYLSLEDGHLLALDLQTGAQAWQHRLGGRPGAPLAMSDRVFVGASDRWFYCLSTKDGGRKWRWRHGGLITAAPAVDTRHVYLTGFNNVLRALDRAGGSQRWMRGLPVRPIGGPLVIDDVVAVAGLGGDIRTYRTNRTGDPAGTLAGTSDLAAAPMLVPHPVPELISLVLLTRSGDLQLLRRPLSVAVGPLTEMFGVPVPLGAPP